MQSSLKIITLLLLILAATTSSQNTTTTCPFDYFFELGDGFGDIGNSIRIVPGLPAASLPYGTTFPGTPTGRWSDGLTDVDFAAEGAGLPNIIPYLSTLDSNSSCTRDNDGVIFSVASSPILDRRFFTKRGINLTSYATSLASQMIWFKKYLTSVSSNSTEVRNRLANSLILFIHGEAHDLANALVQGKSIQQVTTYFPSIIQVKIKAARTLIEMGATRIGISGGGVVGCYPYILTAFPSTNATDYDTLGCLKSVNALITSYNDAVQQSINNLRAEFPDVTILYIDIYQASTAVITQMIASGGENIGLRACCGIGGRYNYDNSRFCGSDGVPVCANPSEYLYWDGMHLTQEAYRRIVSLIVTPGVIVLNCTVSPANYVYSI